VNDKSRAFSPVGDRSLTIGSTDTARRLLATAIHGHGQADAWGDDPQEGRPRTLRQNPFYRPTISGEQLMARKTRTIRQSIWIDATPEAVYRALMTTKGHEAFTGAAARISPRVGGRFEAWGGYIHGRNLVLVPARKIVQAWRPTQEDWPMDYYSKVTFRLSPSRGGTRIGFTHSGVLAQHAGHLSSGWKESYWTPLQVYLAPAKPRPTRRGKKSARR
jgi:uncharacterized protein YndB with AHSA1/START domain